MNKKNRQADKSRQEAERVLAEADLLYTTQEVNQAIDRMAQEITAILADQNPVVICLMLGAIIPAGKLLTHLQFPLQLEYVHATRYRGETTGGKLKWIKNELICILNIFHLSHNSVLNLQERKKNQIIKKF